MDLFFADIASLKNTHPYLGKVVTSYIYETFLNFLKKNIMSVFKPDYNIFLLPSGLA